MEPKGILGFDIDGTLTKRNTETILPKCLPDLFRFLDKIGYFFIPVTGKPAAYALRIIQKNGLQQRGVIAENAGVYVKSNSDSPEIFGPNLEAIHKLKKALGIEAKTKGKALLKFKNGYTETIIDPEDVSIFTIFTDPEAVNHKWNYSVSMTTDEIWHSINKTIKSVDLTEKLELLKSFPDGGIQVIRKDFDGIHPIDKSSIVKILEVMFPECPNLPIAMFGDGHNDIPAMSPPSITPITFSNGEPVVKDFVVAKSGFISKYDAVQDIGVADGIKWLAEEKNFFAKKTQTVLNKLHKLFPNLI
jgi:HAD superfamily hydrolase (TIGR01484 family)